MVGLITECKKDRINLYSAAIAYYTLFSLAPISLIITSFWGFFVGREVVINMSEKIIGNIFGQTGVSFYEAVASSNFNNSSLVLAIIAILLVIYGCTRLFHNIHYAFADIFNFETDGGTAIERTIKREVLSMIYLIFLLALALVFVIFNIVVSISSDLLNPILLLPLGQWGIVVFNYLSTYAAIVIIFTVIYRFASYRRIGWGRAFRGALLGSFLFTLASTLFGVYISHSAIIPLYGAASFLVALVLWSYYAALTLLLGAEVAKIEECRYPHHRQKVCL